MKIHNEGKMSYQEKKAVVSLVSNLLIFISYFILVQKRFTESTLSLEDSFKFWGAAMLIFVPFIIFTKMIAMIFFMAINWYLTKERIPKKPDELDFQITLRSTMYFGWVFMAGFFIAMGALVLGFTSSVMFQIFLVAAMLGGITIDISEFYYHRKGLI
jgi:hypothetical protein